MMDHPHQLFAIEFSESEQTRLADFSCGEEPWAIRATEWIRGSSVLDSIRVHNTRVWVFETNSGEVVGFGSVGLTWRKWPPPDGRQSALVIIPMLGIDKRFHGMPSDAEMRYSRQIMSHLISEGQNIAENYDGKKAKPEWMVLHVHRENRRAIRFYEGWNFEIVSGGQSNHYVMQLWIGRDEKEE